MKVKVIKSGFGTYWYADKIGQVFDVKLDEDGDFITIDDEYSFLADDVEIISEDHMKYDVKTQPWKIRTGDKEKSKAVQEWLFNQGVIWWEHKGNVVEFYNEGYLTNTLTHDGFTGRTILHGPSSQFDDNPAPEIIITTKYVVDNVIYPKSQSEQQKQLDIVMEQIKSLQKEAEKLQQVVTEASK